MRPLFLFIFFIVRAYTLDVQIDTPYAVLMDRTSGKVLFSKRGEQRVYPASTTKIATVSFVLMNLTSDQLNEIVSIHRDCLESAEDHYKEELGYTLPSYFLEPDGSTIYLRPGERIYRKDLLYGAMLNSGNDAANAIAYGLWGSIDEFMNRLNAYLLSIGCTNTHFSNPHGLYHPSHYTTAKDLALITRAALNNDYFSSICSCIKYERVREKGIRSRSYHQHNALLLEGANYYHLAEGCKTGYIRKAGYCLSANASNGTRDLIAVLFKSADSKTRYRDAIRLFEAAFNEKKKTRILVNHEDQTFIYSNELLRRDLIAELDDDVIVEFYPSEEADYALDIDWCINEYPIKQGRFVGNLIVSNDSEITKYPLYATSTVRIKLSYLMMRHIKGNIHFYLLGIILLPIAIFFRRVR